MDHHCPWINHCVGWANHAYFSFFLFFSIIGSIHGAIILMCSFYRGIHRYWYLTHGLYDLANVQFTMFTFVLCIIAMGLAIGVSIALTMLLYFQLKSILTNQTGIELWIMEKALYRRKFNPEIPEFKYPYDLGVRRNIQQVFQKSCLMKGDGVEWPVIDGCNQYTLTREQLAQKFEKRARTKSFKCIRPATGRILPLFSQGCRVCMSPPCTDEPRIRLLPGDVIKVTRFRKHWLFGERVLEDVKLNAKKMKRKGPIRGWFPRRCAIELITPDHVSDSDSVEDLDNLKISKKLVNDLNAKNHNANNGKIKEQQKNGKKRN
ncbi:palmitoyltransferase ZDHHC6-like [Teleopsis dalmanni]|uniref:palmitoyltransferase ZDHHC6-like n=1 Tax=Teleopsis dalmanni TaxID=139649 RepID=UPI000D32CFFB|nr:palmitoyltransferase ZDHHC6-like [Teleopsis dalmanni]